jgi:hypothetical protein
MGVQAANQGRSKTGPWVGLAFVAALLAVAPLVVIASRPGGDPSPAPQPPAGGLAYIEFGPRADTLWLVHPAAPSRRSKSLVLEHALDFGIVPALAPDGKLFAYTALPAGLRAATPDSPAGLYVAGIDGTPPRRLAGAVDLLVAPVWSDDGRYIAFRRSSGAGGSGLAAINTASGEERLLVASSGALFPIAFEAGTSSLLYVELSPAGSALRRAGPDSGVDALVATLSAGLTRDWALSPDGGRLAYLVMTLSTEEVSSRAFVLDLGTGVTLPVSDAAAAAFGPAWDASGALTVGSLSATTGGALLKLGTGGESWLVRDTSGFDVPLVFAPDGRLALRSFDGASALDPGTASLVVAGPEGARTTIAIGEVTFLGWIR